MWPCCNICGRAPCECKITLTPQSAVERLARAPPDPLLAAFADLPARATALRERCDSLVATGADAQRELRRFMARAYPEERRRQKVRSVLRQIVNGAAFAASAIAGAAAAAWAARSVGLI